MGKIKIMVACHKPGPVHQDDVFTPIHAGRAISKYKDEMSGMIGDDTGDNISEKNPFYSELTAQYWAWKNMHDVDYIGFCHYRRFFDFEMTESNLDKCFKKHDVIMIDNAISHSIIYNIHKFVSLEDLHVFLMVLKRLYPEYEKTTLDYLYGNRLHTNLMFICKKELFDECAAWLFGILFECEKYIQLSPYNRGKRVYAYLGEYFLPLFFIYNKCKIMRVGRTGNDKDNIDSVKYKLKSIIKNVHMMFARPLLHMPTTFEDFYYPEVLVGFKNDGIDPERKFDTNA